MLNKKTNAGGSRTATKIAVKSTMPKKAEGDKVALSMDKASVVLGLNQTESLSLVNEGKSLLRKADGNGMDDSCLVQLQDYIERCNSAKAKMNSRRKPFTTALIRLQKQFVVEENAIDPIQAGSPAAEARTHIRAWQQAWRDAPAEAERRLLKNRDNYEHRLARRDDLTGEEREAALKRADARLVSGQRALKADAVRTEPVPVVTSADGYLEAFKFWWEGIGKGLPAADLERYLHPMLSFARKQARKGVFITGSGIIYKAVPAL